MNANKIIQLAYLFEQLVKNASVRGNMAKRIMLSLLSHLVPENERQTRIFQTSGAIDIKALRQIISGAKEILEYGIEACMEEISNHNDKTSVERIKNIYLSKNDKYTLKVLKIFFSRNDWEELYGGENWKNIVNALMDIKNSLDDAIVARKNYDLDEEVKKLMNLVAYLNVLDGLLHNTGSIMDKILRIEKSKQMHDQTKGDKWEQIEREQKQVQRLMDTKELQNPDDVLQEILPILENETDAPLTMKDWISAARQKKHLYQGSQEERNKKINNVQLKKHLMMLFPPQRLEKLKNEMQSWSRLPDNKLIDKLVRTSTEFSSFNFFARNLADQFVNDKIGQEILGKLNSLKKINQERVYLVDIPTKDLWKAVWEVYDLIFLAEKALLYLLD